MNVLLTEISMSLGTAFMYYLVRIIMFAAVAGLGIFLGYRFKNKKRNKDDLVKAKEE